MVERDTLREIQKWSTNTKENASSVIRRFLQVQGLLRNQSKVDGMCFVLITQRTQGTLNRSTITTHLLPETVGSRTLGDDVKMHHVVGVVTLNANHKGELRWKRYTRKSKNC